MARKIICDRCGKEIQKERDFAVLCVNWKNSKENYENWESDRDTTHDLCEDCTDEVLMLIGGPEECAGFWG